MTTQREGVGIAVRPALRALVLATALVATANMAWAAPITYDINLTGGGENVVGSITIADGVLGPILPADIQAWEFTGTGSVAFSMSSALGGWLNQGGGPVLNASPASLTVMAPSSTPGDNQQIFFHPASVVPPSSCGGPTFYFGRSGGSPGISYAAFASDPCNAQGTFGILYTSATDFVAGTAEPTPPVPEPASMLLLGAGLVGVATRLRRRQ